MFKVVPATSAHLSEVLAWLERESLETSEGFYCNKEVILESFANEEMYCALHNEQAIGFVIHTLKSVGSAIDIIEIHPSHRGNGFGTRLAQQTIQRLFNTGTAFIKVKCAPRSSEQFWRGLGFISATEVAPRPFEPPQLILRNAA